MADTTGAAPAVPRIASIEGLRGILALWVLFSHVVSAAGLGEDWTGLARVLYVGTHAVDAFIIVSGFVIFYLLDTAREGYGRFLARRALRLYPVYLIALLVSAALLPATIAAYRAAPFPHPHNDYLVAIAEASWERLPAHMAAHLTMLHAMVPAWRLPHTNYAILTQGWSLSLEWQFYVLAPALLWALLRGRTTALAAIALASALSLVPHGGQGFLPHHVGGFATGIACYVVWRSQPRLDWPLLLPAGVALAFLVTRDPALVVWSAVFLATLAPASLGAAAVNRVLQSRPLLTLGRWSYSIYLVHTIVLVPALVVLTAGGAAVLGRWGFLALLLALTLAGTLVLAALLYRFVEAPCIAFGRRMGAQREAALRT